MSLTVAQATSRIARYLEGRRPQDAVDLINRTGQYMHTLRLWRWASSHTLDIQLVAGQQEYSLPANVRQITSLLRERTPVNVDILEYEEMLRRERAGNYAPSWLTMSLRYDAGTVADDADSAGDGVPSMVLRVTPVPTEGGTVTIVYDRGWSNLRGDNDIIAMPDWMHPLFEALLRAFTLGTYRSEAMPLHRLLDEVTGNSEMRLPASSLYTNTIRRDGTDISISHRVQGGAMRMQYGCMESNPQVYPYPARFYPAPRE